METLNNNVEAMMVSQQRQQNEQVKVCQACGIFGHGADVCTSYRELYSKAEALAMYQWNQGRQRNNNNAYQQPRYDQNQSSGGSNYRTSPSVMYPVVLLRTAPLVSSSPSSVSPTANVGLYLGSSRPTDTPPLTPAKSRTSLLDKLSTPPTVCSSLSEMATRAFMVRSIPGQIQRQSPATSSMKPVDHSPAHQPLPYPWRLIHHPSHKVQECVFRQPYHYEEL
ncbi:hypothetical protein LWI28_019304 [Acer negundo]|uniref:Uncharacterized protein n=1 Tax=Acer negundo TaxID=4023 RepID=A0AAD5NZX8_ACENE|nr:hypothetical protein LWI28_019304 [Acer negundo]